MFPLAFVAGWLQGHWWGFISRNYVVWPTFLLMNVFIALKRISFLIFICYCKWYIKRQWYGNHWEVRHFHHLQFACYDIKSSCLCSANVKQLLNFIIYSVFCIRRKTRGPLVLYRSPECWWYVKKQRLLRKRKLKIFNLSDLDQGQWLTLTFGTHKASCTH